MCHAPAITPFEQYFRMLRIVQNKGSVKHKMRQDGVEAEILDMDPLLPLPDDADPDVKLRSRTTRSTRR